MRGLLRKIKRRTSNVIGQGQPEYLNIMVRGGRMTKVAGIAASFAPTLGTVGSTLSLGASSIALGTALSVSGALAGNCGAIGGGAYVCIGPADPAADVTQTLSATGALNVGLADGFGLYTNVGDGFYLGGNLDGTSILLTDIYGADITGYVSGIDAYLPSGAATDITINTAGNITGNTDRGIHARNYGTGDITISNTNLLGNASVTGNTDGIDAYGDTSTNSIAITTNNVTGTNGNGIDVLNFGGGTTTITSTNAAGTAVVTGGTDGIQADNSVGAGAMTITANTVYGYSDDGIDAYAQGNGLFVTADGTVDGFGNDGIRARNSGSGNTEVTVTNGTGDAFVRGFSDGLYAYSSFGTVDLLISVNDVYGANGDGIRTRHYGSGNTEITATNAAGDAGVNGYNTGIYAYGDSTTAAMTITVNNVTASNNSAVVGRHYGSGDLTVTATNAAGTAELRGYQNGIFAYKRGTGSVNITANDVYGYNGVGIYARVNNDGTDLTITVDGEVESYFNNGINARHYGSGNALIDVTNATGDATVDVYGTGIYSYTSSSSGATTILTNLVYTDTGDGIYARHFGSGDLTITATNADGAGQVTGYNYGIRVRNYGEGDALITANSVTSTNSTAIYAYGDNTSDTLSITVDGVVESASNYGIYARTYGDGSLTVTATNATGDASVTGGSGGIRTYAGNNVYQTVIDANNVTGYGASGIYVQHYGTGAVSITSANADGTALVYGSGFGIYARNSGDGAVEISVDNVTGFGDDGIFAYNNSTATDITILARGAVEGYNYGIRAVNDGTGNTTITATNADGDASVTGGDDGIYVRNFVGTMAATVEANNVYSTNDSGIYVYNAGSGDLSISSTNAAGTATVQASDYGIYARNFNGGAVIISANNVESYNTHAIYAYNDVNGTSIAITTTGTVTGDDYGIYAQNYGSEGVTITGTNPDGTGQITGLNGGGIYVENYNGGAILISVDNVAGDNTGIYAENDAMGSTIFVYGTGTISGDDNDGIDIQSNGTGGVLVDVTNADGTALVTTMSGHGIDIDNDNGGAVRVIVDNVVGTEEGIEIDNDSDGLFVSVTVTGDVTAGTQEGIDIDSQGMGGITINATNADGTSQITALDNEGILADNDNGGAVDITVDNVIGDDEGLDIDNDSDGTSVSVTVNGTVESLDNEGMDIDNNGSEGVTVTVTNADGTAEVIADEDGIEIDNNNGGGVTVVVDNVTNNENDGVDVDNNGMDTTFASVTVNGSVTTIGDKAIEVENEGTGDVTVNASNADGTVQVTSYGGDGVYVDNDNGGAVFVTVDNVMAASEGIEIYNDAAGTSVSVTVNGMVTSATEEGIYAYNEGSGDLTISVTNADGSASVTGDTRGIYARNYNGGAIDITADNATGTGDEGIYARNDASGTSLSITSVGASTGGYDGIYAYNEGSGDLTILSSNPDGTAMATGSEYGINARNYNGGALSVTADNATGAYNGILARNDASGTDLSVAVTQTATATAYDGIFAQNEGSGDLTVMVSNPDGSATATGQYYGVNVFNYNGGAIDVTADNATGTLRTGIYARNDASGTSLSITSVGVSTGGYYGVLARNYGTGDLLVDVSNPDGTAQATGGRTGITANNYNGGALTVIADNATGTNYYGINAFNAVGTTDLSVTTTGTVTGGNVGIFAINNGTGDLTVMATNPDGTAMTSGYGGIVALNSNGGAITIAADNVMGGLDGIYARNDALGTDVAITTYGAVSADTYGIRSFNYGSGDLSVTSQNAMGTASVTGGEDGINVYNYNGGSLIIVADNVTGLANDAISGYNDALGTSLSVTTTGTVDGADEGIQVLNYGSGDTSVMATNATGTANVIGGDQGIDAVNYNGGALTIVADNVSGGMDDAIYAYNDGSGTTTSVTTYGTVSGSLNGIYALHQGTGPLSVTVSGTTTGGTTAGIYTTTGLGGLSIITLGDGADVSGTQFAVLNDDGDSDSYFNDGSTVSGVSNFGDGSDDLTIANSDITAATVLDGGDDSDAADGFVDALTFSGFNGSFGADLLNWEEVVFDNSDATFVGAAITTPTVDLINGTTFSPSQTGFMLNSELSIDGTSTFNAGTPGAGNVMINGNVSGAGTLSTVDDAADDQLTVNGNLTGTGTLAVDADISTATADRISIAGNANGPGEIDVNPLGTTIMPAEITLVDVGGATSEAAFTLGSANFTLPGGEDAQVIGAFTYTLGFDAPGSEFFITPFDANGNVIFNPVTTPLEAYPTQLTLLNQIGSTFQSWGNRPGVGQGAVAQNLFDFDPTPENAIWFSLGGTQAEYQGQSTLNANVDTDVTSFEMGVDFPVFDGETGRLVAGASFEIQDADTDISTPFAAASVNTTGSSLTLNALWLGDNRFYANSQLRYSTFSTDMFLGGFGPVALGTQGEGIAASFELGRAYAISEVLTLVPQFQLTYSDVSGDGIADPFGSGFAGTITDGETTTARVGMHAERVTGNGSIFGSVSYIHAFDADTTVSFGGFPFTTSLDENRIELRAGGQMTIGENSILYGGLTAQGGLSDFGDDNSYGLTGGIRVNF